jgi:hypothetical protein
VIAPVIVTPPGSCPPDAGYLWCAAKKKCLRAWEEPCYEFGTIAASSAPRDASGLGLYRNPTTGLYDSQTTTAAAPAAPFSPPATYVPPPLYVPATLRPGPTFSAPVTTFSAPAFVAPSFPTFTPAATSSFGSFPTYAFGTSTLPSGCICGRQCTMSNGNLGYCQTDRRTCAQNIAPPDCTGY